MGYTSYTILYPGPELTRLGCISKGPPPNFSGSRGQREVAADRQRRCEAPATIKAVVFLNFYRSLGWVGPEIRGMYPIFGHTHIR